jgi:hypothetical protein
MEAKDRSNVLVLSGTLAVHRARRHRSYQVYPNYNRRQVVNTLFTALAENQSAGFVRRREKMQRLATFEFFLLLKPIFWPKRAVCGSKELKIDVQQPQVGDFSQ